MRLPIQYALTWPERRPTTLQPLALDLLGSLSFRKPDLERFPALGLGWELIERGGTTGAVAVRSNEVAREAFLRGELAFTSIYQVVRRVLDEHQEQPVADVSALREAESWAEERAREAVSALKR